MKTPTEFEVNQLLHLYDPVKAHEYYERTKKLKGRKRGRAEPPRTGQTREQIAKDARARQRQELAQQIQNLENKLKQLQDLIRKKEREEASKDRKSAAKKERARKEADKPKTAAEKAEIARENKKYRDKNQQKLKADRKKDADSGGGGSSGTKVGSSASSEQSVSDLKSLATKVKGQIAVAKQKLAAL